MRFKEPGFLEIFITLVLGRFISSAFYQQCVDSLGLKGNEKVLDYGSGSGFGSKHIAKYLLKDGGQLTCVDISKVWMKTIKKRLKKFPNVEFKHGDISNLNIEDNRYDAVIIHFVLHEVEKHSRQDKVNILSSKLKKKGKLIIKEPTRKTHGIPLQEIRDLMTSAGLKETDFKISKSRLFGQRYEGIFSKIT